MSRYRLATRHDQTTERNSLSLQERIDGVGFARSMWFAPRWRWPRRRWVVATALGTAAIAGGAYLYYWLYGDDDDDDQVPSFFKGQFSNHDATSRALGSQQEAERNLQKHFESIQKISDSTTLPQMLLELERGLDRAANVDILVSELRQPSGGSKESNKQKSKKMERWNELKVVSWSRTLSATWLVALLDLLLRVQLNILGRHLFFQQHVMDSPRAELQTSDVRVITESSQEMFLEYAHYLPERAVNRFVNKMREIVEAELRDLDLRTPLDKDDVLEHATSIHQAFEEWAVEEGWAQLALPSKAEAEEYFIGFRPSATMAAASGEASSSGKVSGVDGDVVQGMVDELHMVMKSVRFSATLLEAVQEAARQVAKYISLSMDSERLPLAKVIPKLSAAGNSLLNVEAPGGQEWLQGIANLPRVTELCASVYSCGPPPAYVGTSQ